MALTIGSANADSGMSLAIYTVMDAELAPPLQAAIDAAPAEAKAAAQAALAGARVGWKKLAFAIASGVIAHLKTNMEIVGVTVAGDVTAVVRGDTGPAEPAAHKHAVSLNGVARAVVLTQSNDGPGRVR